MTERVSFTCLFFTLLILLRVLVWQHIAGEGTALVKEAEYAATNQVEYFF